MKGEIKINREENIVEYHEYSLKRLEFRLRNSESIYSDYIGKSENLEKIVIRPIQKSKVKITFYFFDGSSYEYEGTGELNLYGGNITIYSKTDCTEYWF